MSVICKAENYLNRESRDPQISSVNHNIGQKTNHKSNIRFLSEASLL